MASNIALAKPAPLTYLWTASSNADPKTTKGRVMNCPSCKSRNPSGAKRCLHCGITFETEDAGLLGLVADAEGEINWGYIFVGVVVAFLSS
ncbi:MAG: hypothetical protein R3E66_04585 [bacterium]